MIPLGESIDINPIVHQYVTRFLDKFRWLVGRH